jgi:hypothetical protein
MICHNKTEQRTMANRQWTPEQIAAVIEEAKATGEHSMMLLADALEALAAFAEMDLPTLAPWDRDRIIDELRGDEGGLFF